MISQSNLDWYRNHIRPDSVSFAAIGLLRYRPCLYKNLVKKLEEKHPSDNIYKCMERMRKRNQITIQDGKVAATDKSILLHTASLLDISPLAFMILSFAYSHVKDTGFFVRDYDEYYQLGHSPLFERQMIDAFSVLVKKGLVRRHATLAGLYTIPDGKMRMLKRYHDILLKSVEVTQTV